MKLQNLVLAIVLLCGLNANGQSVKKIISYSKGTSETRVLTLLSDNTMWWSNTTKPWAEVTKKGLPAGTEILDIESYQKTGMVGTDTRLILLTGDGNIFWFATESKGWEKIETTGLPKDRKIIDISVYVKFPGQMMEKMRLVALMADNSIWWFAPGSEWQQLELQGLPAK
ncbi:MAG TPA: hypothetical protein VFZ78_11275 [Flavisolibacter sp.]